MKAPVVSVVDYEAWARGYMPPSEHILIDELSYRGARIVSSSSAPEGAWWLVVRGHVPTKGLSKMIFHQIEILEEAEEEARNLLFGCIGHFARAACAGTNSPQPDGGKP